MQGYRRTSLDAEIARAAAALRAAGVNTDVVRADSPLTKEQEELLSWVVREGATNVIRHARASRATIAIDSDAQGAKVCIEDDGAGPDRAGEPGTYCGEESLTGSGLAGLRERLVHAGGTLQTHGDSTGFSLTVLVPPPPPRVDQ